MRLGLKISLINMYACIPIRNTRMIPCKNNTNNDDGHARDRRGGGVWSSLAWRMDTKNRGSQIMDAKILYSEIMKISKYDIHFLTLERVFKKSKISKGLVKAPYCKSYTQVTFNR